MYYLMQFFRMSITNRKAAVCLSAFLFGPAYLFYRKMWKEGLLTAILTIVLSIPTFIEIISVFNPSLLGAMPLGWLPVAVNVCAVASWALNIILGLFAVSWYRREAKKNIDRIYADYPDGEARTDALLQKGGTNLLAALLYFGIMLLLCLAGHQSGRARLCTVRHVDKRLLKALLYRVWQGRMQASPPK